ncbi:MAG TPA: hypothetical protein VFS33_07285 [Gemmatimonadales bacterium]|nr:hypothetical protein [Gemmatimonadales bacterium]
MQAALDGRRRDRKAAARAVPEGRFAWEGPVAWAAFDGEIDGEFFPALLPGAGVIVTDSPHPDHPGRWIVKVRLGAAAPAGVSLGRLAITETIDPAYGGRWNAGSCKRGGGSALDPVAFAAALRGSFAPPTPAP